MIGKNSLPNKHEGEKIICHRRRHWFVFFKLFLFFAVLLMLPYFLYYIAINQFPLMFNSDTIYAGVVVLTLSYYLIMLVFSFTTWTENYLDVWTVTTERIISRDQNALFNRTIAELYLYRIQDVTAEQKGFFPTIFHYGNVYIQTAGEKERFIFSEIGDPYAIAKTIQELSEVAKHCHHVHE